MVTCHSIVSLGSSSCTLHCARSSLPNFAIHSRWGRTGRDEIDCEHHLFVHETQLAPTSHLPGSLTRLSPLSRQFVRIPAICCRTLSLRRLPPDSRLVKTSRHYAVSTSLDAGMAWHIPPAKYLPSQRAGRHCLRPLSLSSFPSSAAPSQRRIRYPQPTKPKNLAITSHQRHLPRERIARSPRQLPPARRCHGMEINARASPSPHPVPHFASNSPFHFAAGGTREKIAPTSDQ